MEDAILGWQSDREIPDENEEVEGLEALIATQGDRSLLDSLLQLADEEKKDNLLAAISQEPWRTKLAALKYSDYLRGVAEVRLEFWHLVESLLPSKPLSELEAGILKSGLLDEHAIRSRVALRLAFDFVWDLPKRVSRSLELSELALTTPVSDSQRRYFSLLRRCYVAGFFSECVILCRAIIEGQLKATYVRLRASNIHDKMEPMIAGAENLGWLTPESADRARAIVDAGNHAIHGDPDQVADVAGTVKATLTIASELQSR